MTWNSVADVLAGQHTGKTVRLRGWVHRQRSGGKIAFVTLRDGSGVVQCTVKKGVADDESLDAAKNALIESSVSLLEGEVAADDRAPGGYEVKVNRFELHQRAEDFPLRGDQGTEFELDNRHLWLRSTELSTILRVKSRLLLAIREFFAKEAFTEVDPSVITTNACEGGSTLFTFDYFGQTAYLSQSAQMYLEGCIFGNPKVYSVTNSFRAEKSRTNKHLTEFHHLEAEYAWWDNDANMRFQERLVTYLARDVATHCEAELRILGQDPDRLLAIGTYVEGESEADEEGRRFGRMTYHEAAARLRDDGFEFPDGEDFGAPHEKHLTEGLTNPVFITDWPAEIKAFYMHQDPENPAVVKCSDLLGPDGFGELIGGSQRSEDIEWMKERLLDQLDAEIKEQRSVLADVEGPLFAKPKSLAKLHPEIVGAAVNVALKQIKIPTPREYEQWGIPAGVNRDQALKLIKTLGELQEDEDAIRSMASIEHRIVREFSIELTRITLVVLYLRAYEWYFDLRRYGSVPHSGFGLGIERLLRWFTGQEHIRDMLPYPRTPNRAYP